MEVEIPLIGHNEKRSKQIAKNASDKQEARQQYVARPDMRLGIIGLGSHDIL
jgi:hypothetical protein